MKYSLYQRKRNGRKGKTWYMRYRHDDVAAWISKSLGVTNKQVADQKARELIEQMEREAAGLVLPPKQVEAAAAPITDLVQHYKRHLKSKGKNRQYISDQVNRLLRLIAECGWSRLRDITADSLHEWLDTEPLCIMGKRKGKPLSSKTRNDYRDAAYAFCAWLKRRGRILVNPIEQVDKCEVMPTFKRWAMTYEQAAKLLAHAGPRAVLYLTALKTSYRRGTLYRLTWASVDLDGERPTIRPAVETIKNRDEHELPIADDLLPWLRALRPADYKPTDRVFAGLLPCTNTAEFLHEDMKRTGIPIVNEQGHVFDFHGLRHTACTWAAATGLSGAVFRAFTGHKTEKAAAKYLHMNQMPVADVLAKMPQQWTHIGTQKNCTTAETQGKSRTNADNKNSRNALHRKKKPASAVAEAGISQVTPTGFEPVLPG